MAWAVCAECNTRYDARTLAFCPRCGGTARAGSDATPGPGGRRDPARMRLQLGGVLLLILGGLFLAAATTALMNPGATERQVFLFGLGQDESFQGGEVAVRVLDDGLPVPGANVTMQAGNRTLAAGATDLDGRFNATLRGSIAVNVTVTRGTESWLRQVLAPQGVTATVAIDLAHDAASSDRVVGAQGLALTTMLALLVLSLLLSVGGLAAVLVRWRGLALAGPLPVVALAALLVLLYFSIGPLLFLAMLGAPYALVVSGRSAFRR
ncbi:MAG: hypothetical protein ABR562_00820 [Thermoplasmatota archaeon]